VNEKYQIQIRASQDWQTVETTSRITLAKIIARDLLIFGHPVRVWYIDEVVFRPVGDRSGR
jgi:hypothetical protein